MQFWKLWCTLMKYLRFCTISNSEKCAKWKYQSQTFGPLCRFNTLTCYSLNAGYSHGAVCVDTVTTPGEPLCFLSFILLHIHKIWAPLVWYSWRRFHSLILRERQTVRKRERAQGQSTLINPCVQHQT